MLSPEEKLSTAYHESGHALLGMLTPGADPVRRVTIIPRGQALGVTVQTPQADRYGYSEKYLRGRIAGALGGRAAEEIVYGEVTTGAESDLDQATRLARQMVGRWGMSPAIGPVSVLPPPGQEQPFGGDGVAPATKELVDEEVRRLVEDCYGDGGGDPAEQPASGSTAWPTRCSNGRRWTRTTPTPPPGSPARRLRPPSPAARCPAAGAHRGCPTRAPPYRCGETRVFDGRDAPRRRRGSLP